VLITTVSPAKMAEVIKMPFWGSGVRLVFGPRNCVLDGKYN